MKKTAPLPPETLESSFSDFKPALDATEANLEAQRCLNCYEAPCIQACPTEINIPQFISRIYSGNILGAAKTILDSNSLGLSCAKSCPTEVLCEGSCVYHGLNSKPIAIGKLQQFAVERAYAEGANFYTAGAPSGKQIALVGAGPASLACAHELRKKGHRTLIYEKEKIPGGLNTWGIAPYKMKAPVSLLEISELSKIGIEFKFGQELGTDFSLKELVKKYDAVFLGIGLGPDRIPKGTHPRIQGAVDFISKLKTRSTEEMAWVREVPTAIVIGGGNTALDACRELRGIGIPKVILCYRRSEKEMSGYAHELKAARQEGVEVLFNVFPMDYTAISERRVGVKFQGPEVSEYCLEGELVLTAIGQTRAEGFFAEFPELEFDKGCLKTDPLTGQTKHPKIFAAGDLANGGKEVVNAVAEGKRTASAIHTFVSLTTKVKKSSSPEIPVSQPERDLNG